MQNSEMNELIEEMKLQLLDGVSEWLGSDIPTEGTEDYDIWQYRLQEIEQIKSFTEINAYLENLGRDTTDFFETWGLRFNETSGNVEYRGVP